MQPRQLDAGTLEQLLDAGFQVTQWRENSLLHLKIDGPWKGTPAEVDKRVEQIVDLRPFSTSLTGTDPINHTRFLIYKAHPAHPGG